MKGNILIIQNILKKQDNYELSLLLEGARYSFVCFEEYNDWEKGILELYVHPNSFLEVKKQNDTKKLKGLQELFQGIVESNQQVHNIEIKINSDVSDEKVNECLYIFVDEAGDMDFSKKGSRHYMFNFLIKRRPFNLHEYISNYRYSLLERNLDPLNGKRLNIEAFHACEDNKYIKNELFKIISTFNKQSVQTYSYILEKPKVSPDKRREKEKFYIDNLSFAIGKLLDKLQINKDFIIITDRLPHLKNKNKQVGALKKGIKQYLKNNNLSIRYDIFHHCSASSVNLQVVDYLSWAVFRKFEHGDDSYFKRIEQYLIGLDDVTKDRVEVHYER